MTTRASVTINSREDREKVARWAEKVPEGTIVEFRKKTRSAEQNAKLHAMLGEVSEQVDWYGNKLEPEDWKTMFTASLRKANVIPGIDAGTVVPLGLSTSAMTVEEMSNLIELIYAFGAERDVVFKEPQEPNTNSATADQSPSGQLPDNDEDRPSSSQEDGADGIPQTGSSPSSTISLDEYRDHFIDFARKALTTASDANLAENARMEAIEGYVLSYREVIPESLWQKLSGVKMPVLYVVTGQRTVEQARSYIARDLLECSVQEIGG